MTKIKLTDELEFLKRRLSKIESDDGSSIITGDDKEIKQLYNQINVIESMLRSKSDKK